MRHAPLLTRRHDVPFRLLEPVPCEDERHLALQAGDAQRLALEPQLSGSGRRRRGQQLGDAMEGGARADRSLARRLDLRLPLALAPAQQRPLTRDEAPAVASQALASADQRPGVRPTGEGDPPRRQTRVLQPAREVGGEETLGRRLDARQARQVELLGSQQLETGGGGLLALHRRQIREMRRAAGRHHHEALLDVRGAEKRSQIGIPAAAADDEQRLTALLREQRGEHGASEVARQEGLELPLGHGAERPIGDLPVLE